MREPPRRDSKAILIWIVPITLAGLLGWWYWSIHPDPDMPDGVQEVAVRSIQGGDTMEVAALSAGRVIATTDMVRVQLLGIDAPDMGGGSGGGGPQCWAEKARAELGELAPQGSRIWVIGDVQAVDDKGRRLLYAWTRDGVFVNARLAESGSARLATAAPKPKYEMEISKKVNEARQARRGLWGACAN